MDNPVKWLRRRHSLPSMNRIIWMHMHSGWDFRRKEKGFSHQLSTLLMTKTNKERQSTKCDFSQRNRIWPTGDGKGMGMGMGDAELQEIQEIQEI